jgi:hypothetical protein
MSNIQGGTNYAGNGSNTLTSLVQTIYEARDKVAREFIGLTTVATRDASEDIAAIGQTIRSPVTQAVGAVAIVPNNVVPNSGGQTILYRDLVINNSYSVPLQWTGEEQRAVGAQYDWIIQNQFEQAFRTLGNTIEASLVSTMVGGTSNSVLADQAPDTGGTSRAYGTAGTTPFGYVTATNDGMLPFAQANLILDNNGCPATDRCLVLSNSAYQNIVALPNIYKVNQYGGPEALVNGFIGELGGFKFYRSGQLDNNKHTAGTGTGYTSTGSGAINGTQYQVGETLITLGVGSGTVLNGDIVTFAGDANKYVVAKGVTAPGIITLSAPGLQQTLSNGVAMTIGASYTANLAFDPTALMLATRAPLMPMGGDAASDVLMIADPLATEFGKPGISYQIAQYRTYRMIHTDIGVAWGSLANKPEFAAMILG